MTDAPDLFSPASLGLLRVAAISPALRVADVVFNVHATIAALEAARAQGCTLAVCPELGITGYTCGDLFRQASLLEAAQAGLLQIVEAAGRIGISAVVGLPVPVDGRIFNCAAFVSGGRVLGIVPKTYLPNYSEFYEQRWFSPARFATTQHVTLGDQAVPFGTDLLFAAEDMPDCMIGVEICEDLWAVEPPSGAMARAGATVLLNPSASPEQLGKVDYRRDLVRQQSARCIAAYLYAGSGAGESTTDVVYSGHALVCENGNLLAETERFHFDTQIAIADLDLQRLRHDRWLNTTYFSAGGTHVFRAIPFRLGDAQTDILQRALRRPLIQTPFVPSDPAARAKHCREIFAIQATGLAKRLMHVGARRVTIGVSGGLDSTLALLVAARAFDKLSLPREGIVAITMPGFGTTDRTRSNAWALMQALGVTAREIPIRNAVSQHFADIGHDPNQHDVTYENAQARERTQILMDVANQVGGFVVGTGDLSELALGWATFNGDHMSMYHVNAGVPKTLVRYIVDWCADEEFSGETSRVLHDISASPITPELLPLKDGKLQQETEAAIGPYVLHDFFLFYHVRYGYAPHKIFYLAHHAFNVKGEGEGERIARPYTDEEILKWLGVFYRRFFSQQFKRNAMPDGPKVGSVALSPRGDWRMPSDAQGALWQAEVEAIRRALAIYEAQSTERVA
ncbi:MAG: NAD(+) synthase [Candidatus Brachytrichaceae bacterium NZ_4S206]|jgi:NAD+ synthase (glutamine-hydrolysing)